jgi:hypothetical protein
METLWSDLRYGFRMLTRNRGFTIFHFSFFILERRANSAGSGVRHKNKSKMKNEK